ncbi:hypothetical protein BJ994_000132 [Arthrobacter pigmenti]|uniref:Uncharacterized protein n=1 Tax=Arthrobacter pigmenti TaxID=271432 RepID=A0A846RPL9_9MICC|nr:hypothetical protein [Arthrobacter pigmenti]NJC21056.1 hypothetical protein [Arthrobacter pigmenti]
MTAMTAEEAIEIISDYHQNNPDLRYDAFANGNMTFDVKVISLSLMEQGGSGNVGMYIVTQSGGFWLK